jgi:hypothetical protein
MTERCEHCYYWVRFKNPPPEGGVQKGECHKHSPDVLQKHDPMGTRAVSKWPPTAFHEGCGDFRPHNWRELREKRNAERTSSIEQRIANELPDWKPGVSQ